jgi:hypothetical protein
VRDAQPAPAGGGCCDCRLGERLGAVQPLDPAQQTVGAEVAAEGRLRDGFGIEYVIAHGRYAILDPEHQVIPGLLNLVALKSQCEVPRIARTASKCASPASAARRA